jgi:hypothetical protein
MKKEKLSYLILIAEIVAISWLHSTKVSTEKEPSFNHIVKKPEMKASATVTPVHFLINDHK